jgi:hypothetical protein
MRTTGAAADAAGSSPASASRGRRVNAPAVVAILVRDICTIDLYTEHQQLLMPKLCFKGTTLCAVPVDRA